MAAYAALVSVTHIMNHLHHHPQPPISVHERQLQFLTQKITFLQDFLESYAFHRGSNKEETDGVESRIADAAYAAEDIIESHIVYGVFSSAAELYDGLQKVIEDMESIEKDVTELKQKERTRDDEVQRNSRPIGFSRSSSTLKNNTIVGIDDVLIELMHMLTGGQLERQVIPIVGMGGIGKTTLARHVYENQTILRHFDILAWATISQEYRMTKILSKLYQEGDLSEMDEYELGEMLRKRKLYGRRYLIVLDDFWDLDVWEKLMVFFPENNNGSRILLTTRLSKLALEMSNSRGIKVGFLDESYSWSLFCKIVFGSEDCPLELEEIGRKIVESCRGLPLSINVIGGLLARFEQTQQYWEYIAENLSEIVNSKDDEHCLSVLYTSYSNLPVYLKPCFIYMGVFTENRVIIASELVKMWVAEGFIKLCGGKSLEDAAEDCLEELVGRNLILVRGRHNYETGKKKLCEIHDLLRDLCIREARKQKFFFALGVHSLNNPHDINSERRICIHHKTKWEKQHPRAILDALESSSVARSLIWEHEEHHVPIFGLKLLRVYSIFKLEDAKNLEDVISTRVNLRYINVQWPSSGDPLFPSSLSNLWNLQTLIFCCLKMKTIAPSEIWKMSQLRHIKFWPPLELPDPPTDDVFVWKNIHTLTRLVDFKFSEKVVEMISNIKRLIIDYEGIDKERIQDFCLNRIGRLHELKSLRLHTCVEGGLSSVKQNLIFPESLKKLDLCCTRLQWEDVTEMIGSLPCLNVLKLRDCACIGQEWHTVEGQFCSLKFLKISGCYELEYWNMDSSHFPKLEHIVLRKLKELKEVPSSIGDIPTLHTFELKACSDSAFQSAQRIQEQEEDRGDDFIQFQLIS